MTEIGFIIQPGEAIPEDVTALDDRMGDGWEPFADEPDSWRCVRYQGQPYTLSDPWHRSAIATAWGPLTVTAVREQPAEPGCPRCGTILNAKAAHCADPWHADNQPAAEAEPDVLDLVRQYGGKREQVVDMLHLADREELAKRFDGEGEALFGRIEAEVNRLRTERDGGQQAALTSEILVQVLTEERDEARAMLAEAREMRNAAVDRVRRMQADRALDDELQEWSNGQLMQALGVEQLPEVIPAIERLKAAAAPDPSAPLVLSLPTVPDGAVAIIGEQTGRRYVLRDGWWRWDSDVAEYSCNLAALIADEGSVTVVMREPRTPLDDVQDLRDELTALHEGGYAGKAGHAFSIVDKIENTIRKLTGEVFDDKDSTR